jgi:hypothetical protein
MVVSGENDMTVMNQLGAALFPQNAATTTRFVESNDTMNAEPMTSKFW